MTGINEYSPTVVPALIDCCAKRGGKLPNVKVGTP